MHRLDAAMGFPRFHRRGRRGAIPLPAARENRVHRRRDAAGRIAGVRAKTTGGAIEIAADLVVGCDGRHSDVRAGSGFGRHRSRRADGCAVAAPVAEGATTARPSAGSRAARCSSRWIGTTIGNAPISSPRATTTPCGAAGSRHSAPGSLSSSPNFRPHRRDQGLGRRQAADGCGRSAARMAQARPADDR